MDNLGILGAKSAYRLDPRFFPAPVSKGIDRIFEIAILAPPHFDPPSGRRSADRSLTSEDSVQNVAMLRVDEMSETAGFPAVPS